ncbi:hypothetical protein TD95_002555 [Thielaviopsis punctulata]|uniref:Endoplasmic reticulum junction formation protein lunapark n=1 Tax=Thielaviopsis punctulata TaxID=72032 RepID=A0A0F4ZMH7_9PEZI|nr:hypothetical protein TD95_002555 [Thielaviopsis punctulata]
MVSFWPWRGDASSTATFEKALSTLSSKITAAQVQLDATLSRARRVKVLSVLYLTFAYLVYVIVSFLVVGSQKMGTVEWTGVAGSPVVIYVLRQAISAYYDFRIDTLDARLKELTTEREKTIQKLKDATKYDSTLELLEKYGGSAPKKASSATGPKNSKSGPSTAPAGQKGPKRPSSSRTVLPPPPTANINRGPSPMNPPPGPPSVDPTEEFAPNAFSSSSSPPPAAHAPLPPAAHHAYAHQRSASVISVAPESHWYDRILDLLLGEDEKDPKNRIVLICQACRVVNGQAPPGVKSLAEVGLWKCISCGASNGEMDEGSKIVDAVRKARGGKEAAGSLTKGDDDGGPSKHDSSSE